MKKILIFGGTGFIGTQLTKKLKSEGNYLILATRNKNAKNINLNIIDEIVEYREGEYSALKEIKAIDVIINLAGESIIGLRWTKQKKKRILESRLKVIKVIEAFVKERDSKIPLLIQASAAGFYGYSDDDKVVNEDAPSGEGFLADTCKVLEMEALRLNGHFNRIAIVRFGIALGNGGFVRQILRGFKFKVGVSIGNGSNWFSWIHVHDVVKGISFIIEKEELEGIINFVAKESIRFAEFTKALARIKNTLIIINIPYFIYKPVIGEMADMLTKGISIEPKKLIDSGYEYEFVNMEEALLDIFKNNNGI
ncbi:TIGR01777 family oxidoreductase [Clostridium sp. C2-6-12]|uniref:TIGR01777 family oxidoreductase n=1 Tax=Clostridium sp. C2-6-12 TaxID=2698832 RepID=UPI00136FB025|nr:TIGR01777 family oxidoreductase [Clostridium sp. C2-6-12]